MKTQRIDHPPKLRNGRAVSDLVVPVLADGSFERGVSLAARYATAWGLPLHFVHVDNGEGDVQAAAARFSAAHPDLDARSSRVSADSIAAGVTAACGPASLVLVASDHAAERDDAQSIGEQVARAVGDVTFLFGPHCTNPTLDGSVVVPLDGSPRAELALGPAIALAEAHGSRIWLLSVVPSSVTEQTQELKAAGQQASESAYIRSMADRLSRDGVAARWEVLHGTDVTNSLVHFVNSNRVIAVVAVSRGVSAIGRRLFGSVCMGLVENGEAPLLLVDGAGSPEPLALS